ncbi:hypothetical protein [Hymenobacter norwichensis]|uniref:hypothetical protein n=1 Tax=Hymenobacter norwichensis TaxID=223903 RepID=UPI0003B31155|nr:hypothetical protein [Hymenobacter norwichensis]
MPDSISSDDFLVGLAAAPYQLQSLPAGSSGGVVGYAALYFLPVESLLADPLSDGSRITGNLALAPGAGWYELKVTQNTIKFDETPKQTRGVTTYTTKVAATRAQNGDEGAALLALEGRRCLVMLREHSGRLRLVGSRESFLVFRSGSEASNPGARAGLDFQFSNELTRPAVYYAGAMPVMGGSTISGAAPVAGAPAGFVQVLNYKGELIATVPAGKQLVLTSGFHITLRVS